MTPKGKLLIIGGHEEKGDEEESVKVARRVKGYEPFEILGALINKTAGAEAVIEIITSASSVPEEMEKWYVNAYKREGFHNVGFLHMDKDWNKEEEATYLERIKKAHSVFFTGGDQVKLVNSIKGTGILKAVIKKYQEDEQFILAGTSAGAMSLSEIIIENGLIGEVLFRDDLQIGKGFGLVSNIIVDTHFIQRGRFARLAQAVIQNPSCLGIGLSENTSLLISGENEAECKGSGMVIIIDASQIGQNNGATANGNTAIVAENLKVHILTDSCKFFLKDKKFVMC